MVNFGDQRLPDRFWNKTTPEPNSGCWLWTGFAVDGYGRFHSRSFAGEQLAHRIAYRATRGAVRPGLQLDHLCRTRCCVNPAHLEQVTHRENVLRGVGITAQQARKTHCNNGHPLAGDNLVKRNRRQRTCRMCHLEFGRRSWNRRREKVDR